MLKISILDGQGAVNNIKQRQAREPVVRITDENDRPIGGALVTFTLPQNGPGAVFSNGARTLTVSTNPNGVAQAGAMTVNTTKGDFVINVLASHEESTATAVIGQTNIGVGLSALSIGLIVGAVAAGTVTAVVLATGNGDSPSPSSPTTIGPGGGGVTAPGAAGRGRGGFRISF